MTTAEERMTTTNADNEIEILLPSWIQDLLNSCPSAGTGVHRWLYKASINLHPFFANREDIAELLLKHSANCGREIDERELWAAIDDSARDLAVKKGQGLERGSR